jgi:hypothetical protein
VETRELNITANLYREFERVTDPALLYYTGSMDIGCQFLETSVLAKLECMRFSRH